MNFETIKIHKSVNLHVFPLRWLSTFLPAHSGALSIKFIFIELTEVCNDFLILLFEYRIKVLNYKLLSTAKKITQA